MFFEQFDKIFVINLRDRPDRKAEMEIELQRLGLSHDRRVSFFEAIRTHSSGPFKRLGSHGAFLSHLAILRAHADKQETILILQDDCQFVSEPRATPSAEWDILYGGYSAANPADLDNSDIIGAHCMGFTPSVIPPLVDFLERIYEGRYRPPLVSKDALAAPIDGSIVWFRRAHPEFRTAFNRVAYQRSSRTDIGDLSFIDRCPRAAHWLRLALRAVRRMTSQGH